MKQFFKLSAYADDVVVIVDKQKDIDTLVKNINVFSVLSSAKVNWEKSKAITFSEKLRQNLVLPGGYLE